MSMGGDDEGLSGSRMGCTKNLIAVLNSLYFDNSLLLLFANRFTII